MAKILSMPCVGLMSALGLACGPNDTLVDQNYQGEPLGLVNGTLSSAGDLSTPEQISLAIMWFKFPDRPMVPPEGLLAGPGAMPPVCTGSEEVIQVTERTMVGVQMVVQPVSFEAEFPIRFQIPITALPPENVMRDLSYQGGTGRLARGILIAYVDGNRNGTFDPGVPGNVPDRILTTSDGLSPPAPGAQSGAVGTQILFLDGRPASPDPRDPLVALNPPQGFSLLRTKYGPGPLSVIHENLPISTPIELTLDALSERIARIYACQEIERHVQRGNRPAGVPTVCQSDGRAYSWIGHVTQHGDEETARTCTTREHVGFACLDPGAPVPPGWPCQVQ